MSSAFSSVELHLSTNSINLKMWLVLTVSLGVILSVHLSNGEMAQFYGLNYHTTLIKKINESKSPYTHEPFCAGSLISQHWVLTSARCVSKVDPEDIEVFLGDPDLKDLLQYFLKKNPRKENYRYFNHFYKVINHTNYPEYNDEPWPGHDISALRLYRPVPVNVNLYMMIPPVPAAGTTIDEGSKYIFAGYGMFDREKEDSFVFKKTMFTVRDNNWCQLAFMKRDILNLTWVPAFNPKRQFCATGPPGYACPETYGTALVGKPDPNTQNVILGVLSFTATLPNCVLGLPAVFTRTTFYENWLIDNFP